MSRTGIILLSVIISIFAGMTIYKVESMEANILSICVQVGEKYMDCKKKWPDGDETIYHYKMVGRIEK